MITLTLPSTASPNDYPNNTVSTFRTKLQEPVSLPRHGEYEVGIAEIQFPTLIANVRDCWIKVDRGKEFGERFYGEKQPLEDGFYSNSDHLMTAIHNRFATLNLLSELKVKINEFSRIVTFHVMVPMVLQISRNLAYILGFDNTIIEHNSHQRTDYKGQQAFDLFRGLEHIYVYSDLVTNVALGHTQAPLLRVVNTNMSSDPTHRCISFTRINWLPLSVRHFDRVLIYLRLTSGEPVPFMSGSCIVTLHIRRRTRSSLSF